MAEWLKAAASKAVVPGSRYRGFESHPLRQSSCLAPVVLSLSVVGRRLAHRCEAGQVGRWEFGVATSMINGAPRILIVRLSAIGDVVRVLPALHALREAHPNAQIDWAVERKAAAIIEDHPALDRLLVFKRPKALKAAARAFWRFCRDVRTSRYDVLIDFHGIFKSGLINAYSAVPDRYGFARPRAQELSHLFTNHKVKLPSPDLNRVEENLLLCEALCPGPGALSPRRSSGDVTIYIPPEIEDEVNAFFEDSFDGGKRVVAVHVPVDRPEKQWPLDHFAKLADLLLADGRFEVMLTWGAGQFAAVRKVVDKAKRHPVLAPEMPTLKHYACLVHCADLYFGGDTGPMHIAAAMGTPVAAVFGGSDPAKHAPYRRPCKILRDETPGLAVEERLRRVTPEMAYEACVRLAGSA